MDAAKLNAIRENLNKLYAAAAEATAYLRTADRGPAADKLLALTEQFDTAPDVAAIMTETATSTLDILKTRRGAKLKLRLLHGRDSPDERMDGWGYQGPTLYADYFHITYGEAHAGYDEEELIISPFLYVKDGLLVLNDNGTKSYYGDWEVRVND